ncbi:MAG: calcium-binding protein, partial [Pseudomonadota bacterium]
IVWQDANGDGFSAASEMQSLTDVGITSIDVGASSINETNAGHSVLWRSDVTWSDGSTTNIDDVYFETDTRASVALLPDNFQYHEDAFKLPVLFGYGQIASTWVALSDSANLRADAEALLTQIAAGDIEGFRASFGNYMYAWAGVDGIDPASRGVHVDARALTFLEKAYGTGYVQQPHGWTNPGTVAGIELIAQFEELRDKLAARFLAQAAASDALMSSTTQAEYDAAFQGHLLSALAAVTSGYSPASRGLEGDITPVFASLVASVQASELDLDDAFVVLDLLRRDMETSNALFVDDVLTLAAADGSLEARVLGFATANSTDSLATEVNVDGSVVITDTGNTSHLVLQDLAPSDVAFSHLASGDLQITLTNGETVRVVDHFWNSLSAIDGIEFADGTILNYAGIQAKSAEDQKATGFVRGTDTSDIYVHNSGDGSYSIQEYDDGYGNSDRLVLTGLNAADVNFSHTSDGDLTITDGTETVTIIDHFVHWQMVMEEIEFADGTILNYAGIQAKSAEDQKATGFVRGTDTSDIYVHNIGDGSYSIQEYDDGYGNSDRLVLTSLNAADVTYAKSPSDDLVIIADTEVIAIVDHFSHWWTRLETIEYADGTILTTSSLSSLPVSGTGGDDTFWLGSGNDNISGLAGNDVINGDNGNDTLYGGEGNDTLNGGNGNDFHFGEAGDDYIYGNSGGDEYDGGAGYDTIDFTYYNGAVEIDLAAGTTNFVGYSGFPLALNFEAAISGGGHDIIFGTDVANFLSAGSGNDTLYGGLGSDTLTGGQGGDTFVFVASDTGTDEIVDFEFGPDKLDISAWGATGFGDLTVTTTQIGSTYDVDVTYNSEALKLTGVAQSNLALLDADDFLFT